MEAIRTPPRFSLGHRARKFLTVEELLKVIQSGFGRVLKRRSARRAAFSGTTVW
jgi:hypothetical protein